MKRIIMKTVMLNITQIKPYWRNPRRNDDAIAAVKQSIQDYGFNQPLILDGDNVIIAGHTRYKALQELGVTKVPCIIKDDLSAQDAKAYRIADNKTSELATWDMDKLIPELREIEAIDNIEIYFPTVSLDDLLKDTAGATNYTPPTQEAIGKVEHKLQAEFSDRSAEKQSQYIEVICPHCTESFHLDKAEILRSKDPQ